MNDLVKLLVLIWATNLIIVTTSTVTAQVTISEGIYEDSPHFIIETPFMTCFYDKAGGGLSRLLDRAGRDWIGFNRTPWDQYPASAASSYRGIPNLVFRSDDSGAGHPGHDQCKSVLVSDNTILTTSLSEKWQWKWTFFDDHAMVELLKIDPGHPYWFLYEGIPGGIFEPSKQYIGNDHKGPYRDEWDYIKGEILYDTLQWIYFGHDEFPRVLYLLQMEKDMLTDTFSYMGNTRQGINSPDGMVVFGFGRKANAQPLINKLHTFIIGFVEQKVTSPDDHHSIQTIIESHFER